MQAKVAIPLVRAVQQFALVLAEAVPIEPEDIAEGTPMAAGAIEIPVAVSCDTRHGVDGLSLEDTYGWDADDWVRWQNEGTGDGPKGTIYNSAVHHREESACP